MKKSGLLIALLCLTSYGYAQFVQSLGIKSGMAISNLVGIGHRYTPGVYVGMSSEFIDHKYLRLSCNLGYVQKGFTDQWLLTHENNPEGNGELKEFTTHLDFLTFSPALKLRYPGRRFTPYLFVGPRLDYFLGYNSDPHPSYLEPYMKDLTLGLGYGIGIEYQLKNFNLYLEGQHQPDFTEFISTFARSGKNQATLLNLGIKFRFGG